ncbi:hypothetical protein [Chitinimonas naiadis]
MSKKRIAAKPLAELPEAPAGGFSQWLHFTRNAQQVRNVGTDIPCGERNACCRPSMFIHWQGACGGHGTAPSAGSNDTC